jgi:hypothetical protein
VSILPRLGAFPGSPGRGVVTPALPVDGMVKSHCTCRLSNEVHFSSIFFGGKKSTTFPLTLKVNLFIQQMRRKSLLACNLSRFFSSQEFTLSFISLGLCFCQIFFLGK